MNIVFNPSRKMFRIMKSVLVVFELLDKIDHKTAYDFIISLFDF